MVVKQQLSQMPPEDRKDLSVFLEKGLTYGCFPYTIFGDKPASFEVYSQAQAQLGKKLWEHYHPLFQIENYILKFQKTGLNGNYFVYLINKKSFVKTIEGHLEQFRAILGPEITPEKLLHTLSQEHVTFEEALNDNQGLKGLLLGFGCTSPFQFQRRAELRDALDEVLVPPNSFSQNALSEQNLRFITRCKNGFYQNYASSDEQCPLSPKLQELCEEFLQIQDKMQLCWPDTEPLALFSLPGFAGDSADPEVQHLFKKYNMTRQEIVKAFASGDFLEVALCKMAQE